MKIKQQTEIQISCESEWSKLESVNIMNCALYRLKRRLNKLQKHAYRSLTTMF